MCNKQVNVGFVRVLVAYRLVHTDEPYINLHKGSLRFIYIVKLGFTGVYIIFYFFFLKHILWVLTEAVLTCTHNLCL